jgi:PAS domain S-box-containing protein
MIAFSVGAALLFFAFYRDAKNAAVANLHEEQRIHAKQAARGIEDFFATWTSSLTALSRMPEILEGAAAGRQQIRLFFQAHREQIRSISRVDEHGVILVSYPTIESEGVDISNQKHVSEILRDHQPVVSDVFRAVQGFDAIALHVPVFEGAVFKGSIAVVVNFEGLVKRYLDVIRIGESGQAWVVSRDGTLLYTPIPGFTGKSALKSFETFPSVIAMLTEMLQGREGVATYTSNWIRDRTVAPARYYAVYAPIRLGNNFWSIVVASSEQELLAGLNSFRNRLGLVVGLVYVGGMLLSFVALKAWVIVREEDKRRQAEEAARSSERLRALMTSAVSDVLFYLGVEVDGNYRFLSVNPAFVKATGLKEGDVVGRSVGDVIPEPARAIVLEKYAAAVAARGTITWDETSVYPAGTKYGEVSITPIFDDGGNCTNLFGIVHDVTERKRAEAELERHSLHLEELVAARTAELESANTRLQEIDRLKSLFIASMSHELRTPLNSIIGFTGVLLQGLAGPLNDEQKKQLGMVKSSSQHLLELITDIIDLSKIEAGKISLAIEEVDLVRLAHEVIASFEPAAARSGLTFALEGPQTLPVVSDRSRIRQVLVNLVGNAVKFTEQGTVTVALEHRDGSARIAVRDTGPGIRAEDMGRLFQFFSRVTAADQPVREGTGLGLYLSRKLVTLLGGEIDALSEVGRGSEFALTLPIVAPKESM